MRIAGSERNSGAERPVDEPMSSRARVAVLVLVLLLGGCAGAPAPSFERFSLWARDGPPGGGPCPSATIEGTLVVNEAGLGLYTGAVTRPVRWPPGYVGGRSGSQIALLDENGSVLARVGDGLLLGGEHPPFDANLWDACRPIVVAPLRS